MMILPASVIPTCTREPPEFHIRQFKNKIPDHANSANPTNVVWYGTWNVHFLLISPHLDCDGPEIISWLFSFVFLQGRILITMPTRLTTEYVGEVLYYRV